MSRVGKMAINLPKGVSVSVDGENISVKGALGVLVQPTNTQVAVTNDAGQLTFAPSAGSAKADAMCGTMRALVSNMVHGVATGFERKLSLVGVGYRAQAQGEKLNLQVGYSHPVLKEMPAGVTVTTPTPTDIVIKGCDRRAVGQVAAEVRAIRPPEPYKGKGVRYADEKISLKETKKK